MRLLKLRNILVATELGDPALPAVVAASQLAGAAGASLHAVSVLTSRDNRRGDGPAQARRRPHWRRSLIAPVREQKTQRSIYSKEILSLRSARLLTG